MLSQAQKELQRFIANQLDNIFEVKLLNTVIELTDALNAIHECDDSNKQAYLQLLSQARIRLISLRKYQAQCLRQLLEQVRTPFDCYKILLPILNGRYQDLMDRRVQLQQPYMSSNSQTRRTQPTTTGALQTEMSQLSMSQNKKNPSGCPCGESRTHNSTDNALVDDMRLSGLCPAALGHEICERGTAYDPTPVYSSSSPPWAMRATSLYILRRRHGIIRQQLDVLRQRISIESQRVSIEMDQVLGKAARLCMLWQTQRQVKSSKRLVE